MKINGNLDGVFKTYQNTKVTKSSSEEAKVDTANTGKSDGVKDLLTLSSDSKVESRKFEVDFIKRRIGDVSATREDKVADIKQRIKDGTYNVGLDQVAEAILSRV